MEKLFNEVERIVQMSRITRNESVERGERFNVFAAVGVDHYETKHSAFIAEISVVSQVLTFYYKESKYTLSLQLIADV